VDTFVQISSVGAAEVSPARKRGVTGRRAAFSFRGAFSASLRSKRNKDTVQKSKDDTTKPVGLD
jgi:hypothetical protein